MISVIIPFHKQEIGFLKEAVNSVLNQTYRDFEIILVPNGDGLKADLSEFKNNPKIKIVPLKETSGKVGEIKKFAFLQGSGDWLLELDWDDILLPTALEEIAKVEGADFVYSNTAEFRNENWESPMYNSAYGWKYRQIEYNGHILNEAISFKPTPASLGFIYYAPNHLRAWKRDFYHQIGGHNPNLEVCDDHEILIRTYLNGKMCHIDKCLYLYRIHGDNTWLLKNAQIQQKTKELYNQYIYPLCERWCDLNGLLKIDLGGRFNCPDGYLSVDLKDADIICDLNKKWKIKDNSVGLIRAWDIFEHLKDKHHTMKEVHRVLVPGGYLLSLTPSALGEGAYQDPTHISFWVRNSFYYYTKKQQAKYIDNDKIRFQVMSLENFYPNKWSVDNNILYIRADLIKINDEERLPGLIEI